MLFSFPQIIFYSSVFHLNKFTVQIPFTLAWKCSLLVNWLDSIGRHSFFPFFKYKNLFADLMTPLVYLVTLLVYLVTLLMYKETVYFDLCVYNNSYICCINVRFVCLLRNRCEKAIIHSELWNATFYCFSFPFSFVFNEWNNINNFYCAFLIQIWNLQVGETFHVIRLWICLL